jgi:hypothetical protein
MAAAPKHPRSPHFRDGFVVAMRAKVTSGGQKPCCEWLIVSRWGAMGEYLSIGWTKVRASPAGAAPIHLAPSRTALARRLRLPPAATQATFLLAQRCPAAMSLAGDFAAAEGYVQLQGRGAFLRLHAEGHWVPGDGSTRLKCRAWRIQAVRATWIGEFIESAAAEVD